LASQFAFLPIIPRDDVRLHHEDAGELPTRSLALLENGLGAPPRHELPPRGRLACCLVDLHICGLDIAASLAGSAINSNHRAHATAEYEARREVKQPATARDPFIKFLGFSLNRTLAGTGCLTISRHYPAMLFATRSCLARLEESKRHWTDEVLIVWPQSVAEEMAEECMTSDLLREQVNVRLIA
jgi:hypothetical protein